MQIEYLRVIVESRIIEERFNCHVQLLRVFIVLHAEMEGGRARHQ